MRSFAKDRAEYVSKWRSHINEMVYPFLDSGRGFKEWEHTRDDLLEVVFTAAALNFPTGEDNE